MKRITTKLIEKMNPCKDRFDNWKLNHEEDSLTIQQFFKLTDITHKDKIWVVMRFLSRTSLEVFAIDCALSAQQYIAAYTDFAAYADAACTYAYAAYAAAYADAAYTFAYAAYTFADSDSDSDSDSAYAYAYAYAYAAYAADSAADSKLKEQQSQLENLLWLLENDNEKN